MATGVVIALLCFFGLFGLLGAIFPTAAIVPILLYIGLLIGAQAFQATPRAHAAAVVAALIPNIASWATGQMDNALAAAGTTAAEVGDRRAGRRRRGLRRPEDARLRARSWPVWCSARSSRSSSTSGSSHAAIFSAAGAVLTFIGLIHGEKVQWNADGQVALGYLFLAVVCVPVRADQARAAGTRARASALDPRGQRRSPRRRRAACRSARGRIGLTSGGPASAPGRPVPEEAPWRSTGRTSSPRSSAAFDAYERALVANDVDRHLLGFFADRRGPLRHRRPAGRPRRAAPVAAGAAAAAAGPSPQGHRSSRRTARTARW